MSTMNNAFANNAQRREPQNVFIAAETRAEAERLAERIRTAAVEQGHGLPPSRREPALPRG